MKNLINRAYAFAKQAHEGQLRKYTGEQYFTHCEAVAKIVGTVDGVNEHMIAAALLHDTVEDTNVTIDDIRDNFGGIVAVFVGGLTDVSKPEDGNRATRKALDREHLRDALPPIQTIKLADLIHNSGSILKYDTRFANIYMAEKKMLLDVLIYGDKELHNQASTIVERYYATQRVSL